MTDNEGRFEFTAPQVHESADPAAGTLVGGVRIHETNLPDLLSARKPGFLENSNSPPTPAQSGKDLTLSLLPEAIIAGQVLFPNSEAPESIQLQLYRREVHDGRAHWITAGTTASKSTGEFRFAALHAGTYKLLTRELLDRDPATDDPRAQLYGYLPVYYQDAPDFDSATAIELAAGETADAQISLAKQEYYNVKIAIENVPPDSGINVSVYRQGRSRPGYALGYDTGTQAIEGMLPNGTYTIEATGFGKSTSSGVMTLNVKGNAVEGAHLALVPSSSIAINVKEEFANKEDEGPAIFNNGKRTFNIRGPRRYLSVSLESADDFGADRNRFQRPPAGSEDDQLVIENAQPGSFWVRIQASRGFVASVRSGTTDLLREPLIVGAGGATSPIEITMRDDFATIDGNVEGITPPPSPSPATPSELASGTAAPPAGPAPAHIYCIPLPDSTGDAAEIAVAPDGSFASPPLTPGTYRLLAFDREQPQLEYRNPEVMKAYEYQGPEVHVGGGQKEHVTVPLIPVSE